MTIDEILRFEFHVEAVFSDLLNGAAENIYPSRSSDINNTPRIELKAVTLGITQERQKLIINTPPGWIYSAFNGNLITKISTNRTTENRSEAHATVVGLTRSRLQQFSLQAWNDAQTSDIPIIVYDIREGETDDSVNDDDNVDVTQITHNIQFSINPNALPETL